MTKTSEWLHALQPGVCLNSVIYMLTKLYGDKVVEFFFIFMFIQKKYHIHMTRIRKKTEKYLKKCLKNQPRGVSLLTGSTSILLAIN